MKASFFAASAAGLSGLLLSSAAQAAVVQLSAGENHTCAVLDSGDVRCWGFAAQGRLGYANSNDIGDDEAPLSAGSVQVGGGVARIATGPAHTCAILRTGELRCWGSNSRGQLGYGHVADIGDDETPASAGNVDVGGKVVQVSLGASHTCALLQSGEVRCWGAARTLGIPNGTDIGDDELPAAAPALDLGGKAVQLAAGRNHTCALLESQRLRCWGAGGQGRLGYGNNLNIGFDQAPASAGDVPVGGNVVQVVAGPTHSCALLEAGKVRCWGVGANGTLGYGNASEIGNDETPASVGDVAVGGVAVQLSAGGFDERSHSCALLASGGLRCWGAGAQGQLGQGNTSNLGDDELPASVGEIDLGGRVLQVAAGGNHTCALLSGGRVRCWGVSSVGQLGYGDTRSIGMDATPVSVGFVPLENAAAAASLPRALWWVALLALAAVGFALLRKRKRSGPAAAVRSG